MCGLVGVFGNITPKLEKAFCDMLIIDEIRGHDSTGVVIITKGNTFLKTESGPPVTVKGTYLPIFLLRSKPFIQALIKPPLLLLGHNRAATKGEVSKKNAHPFTKGHITLSHNGTVYNCVEEEKRKITSDSELLTHLIAEKGIEHTWEEINGAATLTYWNEKEKTLNFISDNKRPFHFVCTENNDAIIWASELGMLHWILERRGVKTEKQHWQLSENVLYTWNFDGKKVSYTGKTLQVKPWHDNYDYGKNYENIYKWKEPKPKKEASYGFELLKNVINSKLFKKNKNYRVCFFCGGDVGDQFELETIYHIDGDIVACEECVITAQEKNIVISKDKLI